MVLIGPPLIQLLVFGYAATFDLNRVPIAIYNQDPSQFSRDLVARFAGSPTFRVKTVLGGRQRIDNLIDSGDVQAALVIDRHFTRDLLTQKPAPIQMIVDGRNSNRALTILGYTRAIVDNFALGETRLHGRPVFPAKLVMISRYNRSLTSQWFIVPGIVALLTQVVTLLVVALSVAREREMGTFDQLLVTPLRQFDILLGKGIPGLLIGGVEASIIIAVAVFWFRVPFHGDLGTLYLGLTLYVLSVTGIGLAISALSATQQQALLGAFLFMVPSVILSGFATPIANMPKWIQLLTLVNPMRYFLIIVRHEFLEGSGFIELVPQLWPMAIIAFVTLGAAAWLFRYRVT